MWTIFRLSWAQFKTTTPKTPLWIEKKHTEQTSLLKNVLCETIDKKLSMSTKNIFEHLTVRRFSRHGKHFPPNIAVCRAQ
jgi:hypothetical protein